MTSYRVKNDLDPCQKYKIKLNQTRNICILTFQLLPQNIEV